MTRYRTTRGVHGQTKPQVDRRLVIAVRFLQRRSRVERLLFLGTACVPLVVAAAFVSGCAALVSWGQYGPDGGAGPSRDASGDGNADNQCYASPDASENDCDNCCDSHHAASKAFYYDSYYGCMCRGKTCEMQCASTDCSADGSSVPGDMCQACETVVGADDGLCSPAVLCADAGALTDDCVAIANCYNDCP
jgi:hypothetical protein